MKIASNIAGALLGALFLFASISFFLIVLKVMPAPPGPPEGSPAALFMAALFPTGYFIFIKCFEFSGGILVAIPKTRNIGLLLLGPVIVNIVAFHVFLMKGVGLFEPMPMAVCFLAAFLLWSGRKAFLGLLN